MRTARSMTVAVTLTLAAAGTAASQQPTTPAPHRAAPAAHRADSSHGATHAYRREVPAALAHQARISEDSARGIAMRRVPGGVVQALELENENGHLMYSFDLKVAGRSGIEEVNVDAMNGHVLATEHEEAQDEARERHAEQQRRPAARPATPPPAPAPRRP